MTLKECYEAMGGNYDTVCGRLRTDERILKFLSLFLKDASAKELEAAMSSGDVETAFRASHTIKGVCLNLSLDRLSASANVLTEELRGKTEITAAARKLYEDVARDYKIAVDAISQL